MPGSFLLYLAEATFCSVVFAVVYRRLFAQLTYFAWNRWYLLGALGASLVLPLVSFPALTSWLLAPADSVTLSALAPFRFGNPSNGSQR